MIIINIITLIMINMLISILVSINVIVVNINLVRMKTINITRIIHIIIVDMTHDNHKHDDRRGRRHQRGPDLHLKPEILLVVVEPEQQAPDQSRPLRTSTRKNL